MVSDEKIENWIEQEIKKDITQEDKVDEQDIEKKLGEMGFLWDSVIKKLKKDGVCFACKKQVDFAGGQIEVKMATKVDKGVVAFVAICTDCITKKGETK